MTEKDWILLPLAEAIGSFVVDKTDKAKALIIDFSILPAIVSEEPSRQRGRDVDVRSHC